MQSMFPTPPKMVTRRAFCAAPCAAVALGIARATDAETEVTIVEFSDGGERLGPRKVKKIVHTDAEWRKLLTIKQLYATRKEATDLPFSGTYFRLKDPGIYRCVCCGTPVFSSDSKFETKTGYPCFSAPIAQENIRIRDDADRAPRRTEVLCIRCDAHLGYLYHDGPAPSQLRYCVNENSLHFVPRKKTSAGD